MPESIFERKEKIGGNLNSITEKQYPLTELRICELNSLATALADFAVSMKNDGLALYEILPLVCEELSVEAVVALPENNLPENEKRLTYSARVASNLDKSVLAELFCERCYENNVGIGESELLQNGAENNSFVYVKNAYSDEAYDVLTEDMTDANVRYVASFKEAASRRP